MSELITPTNFCKLFSFICFCAINYQFLHTYFNSNRRLSSCYFC